MSQLENSGLVLPFPDGIEPPLWKFDKVEYYHDMGSIWLDQREKKIRTPEQQPVRVLAGCRWQNRTGQVYDLLALTMQVYDPSETKGFKLVTSVNHPYAVADRMAGFCDRNLMIEVMYRFPKQDKRLYNPYYDIAAILNTHGWHDFTQTDAACDQWVKENHPPTYFNSHVYMGSVSGLGVERSSNK